MKQTAIWRWVRTGASRPSGSGHSPDPRRPAMIGPGIVDLRPWVVLPGLVDLHVHLEQLPNAGLGSGIGLLPWLERYTFPLERAFDEATAERMAPAAFPGHGAGGHDDRPHLRPRRRAASVDAMFRAAEAHGMRAVIGMVIMDRFTHDRLPARTGTRGGPARVGGAVRAVARRRRRSARLCVHTALRPHLLARDAASVGRPGASLRHPLADTPLGGPSVRSPRLRASTRRRAITSTSTTRPVAWARRASSRMPSISPTGSWTGSSSQAAASHTARRRTCSLPPG